MTFKCEKYMPPHEVGTRAYFRHNGTIYVVFDDGDVMVSGYDANYYRLGLDAEIPEDLRQAARMWCKSNCGLPIHEFLNQVL